MSSGTSRVRHLGFVTLLFVACSAELPPPATKAASDEVVEQLQSLAPVTCPTGATADQCSGPSAVSPSCFVSLGDARLKKEFGQVFRVSREGVAGRVRLVLKRLADPPAGTDPELLLELRPLVGGRITLDSSYTFAAARVKASMLPLDQDFPIEINLTSAAAPLTYVMKPAETYSLLLKIDVPGIIAIGAACHDNQGADDAYRDGDAYSRQMRKTGATTFSNPPFTKDKRDLSFSFTLNDGCVTGKKINCGIGECFREIDDCIAGVKQTCVPGNPVNEICDLKDNDCDTRKDEIDDGDTAGPDLGRTTCGTGICRRTVDNCVNGTVPTCVPGAKQVEQCNLLDDDCDGLTDEIPNDAAGPGLGTTTCGYGRCRRTMDNCVSGSPQACTPDTSKSLPEACDGIDDDCDNMFDEKDSLGNKLTRPYYTGPAATRNVGACRDGVETCNSAANSGVASWGITTTQVTPAGEVCDNVDNNCDGTVDKNTQSCWPLAASLRNVGVCRDGTQTCTTGAWGACSSYIGPTTETCDGKDNDCNGSTDDGLGATTCGYGRCRRAMANCVGGVGQSCTPDWTLQQAEVCNGIDDDCDGLVDEDGSNNTLTQGCYPGPGGTQNVGICRGGSQTCNATAGSGTASWTACSGYVVPAAEVCNSLDDDCDASTDENPTSLCGATANVSGTTCSAGSCQVTACAGGYFNVNGTYGDGCECGDSGGSAVCSSPTSVGTLNAGGSASVSGRAPSTSSSDYYVISFPQNADFYSHGTGTPTISFSSNPGSYFRFDVLGSCSGTFGTCGSALTNFTFNDTCTYSGTNCSTRGRSWPGTVYVRVYRTGGGSLDCNGYTLNFAR